tara:strand:- start:172 stop:369 length:198 start_codon:yes stop_codon:yes gene_type:complete
MAGLRAVASSSLVCMTGIARVGAMVGAMAGAKAKGDDRVLSIIDRELKVGRQTRPGDKRGTGRGR